MKIEKEVENKLQQSGVDFLKSVIANGTSADFYFSTPTSGSVILEVKNWEPTLENINRAKIISNSIRTSANVNQAFVVLPEISSREFVNSGIISIAQISKVLEFSITDPIKIKRPKIQKPNPKYQAFIAMPFTPEFEDTYFNAIDPACNEVQVKSIRIDQVTFEGDIKTEIFNNIFSSDLLIADVSLSNPNVMYEMGFSDGLKKPKIQICVRSEEKMPFDIAHENTIFYDKGRTHALKSPLLTHLSALLNKL